MTAMTKAEIIRVDEMRAKLEKIAARKRWCDDENFMVDDYAGGNVDDAYRGGSDDGETLLARELLKTFFA